MTEIIMPVEPSRMKRKWTFVAATLLVLGIILLAALRDSPNQQLDATLTFAGFTNTDGRMEALFWFTNLHKGYLELEHGWSSELCLSRWAPTGWVEEAQV